MAGHARPGLAVVTAGLWFWSVLPAMPEDLPSEEELHCHAVFAAQHTAAGILKELPAEEIDPSALEELKRQFGEPGGNYTMPEVPAELKDAFEAETEALVPGARDFWMGLYHLASSRDQGGQTAPLSDTEFTDAGREFSSQFARCFDQAFQSVFGAAPSDSPAVAAPKTSMRPRLRPTNTAP